jgi:hypothetical protein
METALANLAAFVNDGFNSTGIADLLGIVVSLIELLLTIAQDVVDAFFALLDSIIPLIIEALDATIEIPFVSQFYWLITEGDSLTLLDLFCLIVAVPTTLATKILTGSNPSDIALGSTNWLGIAYGCSTYVTTPFWIANDVATTPSPALAYIALAGTALNEMLSLAVLCGSSPAFDDFLLYAVELVPLVFGIFGLQVSPDQQPGWSETSTFLSGAYGLFMMGLYGLYAGVRPDTYYAPEGKTLFMDLCSALPNLGQWLKYDSDVGSVGVALVDATGYLATAEIAVDLYW